MSVFLRLKSVLQLKASRPTHPTRPAQSCLVAIKIQLHLHILPKSVTQPYTHVLTLELYAAAERASTHTTLHMLQVVCPVAAKIQLKSSPAVHTLFSLLTCMLQLKARQSTHISPDALQGVCPVSTTMKLEIKKNCSDC